MREIQEHKIKIYQFPETDDEEENRLVKKIKVRYHVILPICFLQTHSYPVFIKTCMVLLQDKLPLAVVGSNTIIEVNSKRVRGRQYPWGVAEGMKFYFRYFNICTLNRKDLNAQRIKSFKSW